MLSGRFEEEKIPQAEMPSCAILTEDITEVADPVVTKSGHLYSYEALTNWYNSQKNRATFEDENWFLLQQGFFSSPQTRRSMHIENDVSDAKPIVEALKQYKARADALETELKHERNKHDATQVILNNVLEDKTDGVSAQAIVPTRDTALVQENNLLLQQNIEKDLQLLQQTEKHRLRENYLVGEIQNISQEVNAEKNRNMHLSNVLNQTVESTKQFLGGALANFNQNLSQFRQFHSALQTLSGLNLASHPNALFQVNARAATQINTGAADESKHNNNQDDVGSLGLSRLSL